MGKGNVMSYDVEVMGEWFNYTSNMRAFFIDFDVYPQDWDGLHRAVVADRIRTGLQNIRANRLETLATEYNSPNGWGKVENAIPWLESVLAACEKEPPSEIVRVS